MLTAAFFKTLIMALGDVNVAPHFEKTAFKANNKIFASLNKDGNAIHINPNLSMEIIKLTNLSI